MKSVAVLAPDTDSGKTVISAALLTLVKKICGKSTVMKPVQTGSELRDGRRTSPDISVIEDLAGVEIARDIYHHVSPYNFLAPCSPHLAAKKEIAQISFDNIAQNLKALNLRYRMTIVESAGGVLSPLTDDKTNVDLIAELAVPAILVSQNRLGSISATLAAVEAVRAKGIELLGIILVDPPKIAKGLEEEILEDNVQTIARFARVEETVRAPYLDNLKEDFDLLCLSLEPFAKSVFGKAEL